MTAIRPALAAAVGLAALAVPATAQELYGTLKKVRDSKVFTIGHREASVGFSYYDENKKPVGFAVEYCERIAAAVKKELKMPDIEVRYLPSNPQTRIPLLTTGTIDIECGTTTNTFARQQQVDFTYSLFATGMRLLVNKKSGIKEVEDLNGKIAGIAPGTTTDRLIKRMIAELKLNVRLVTVRDHAEGMLALESDRTDAYLNQDLNLYGLLAKSTNKDRYEVVGRLLSFEPLGLMVRRDDSAFRLIANRVLAESFRSGEVYELFKKHFDPFGIQLTPAIDLMFKSNAVED